LHRDATEYLRTETAALVTVPAVVTETCFFLISAAKAGLLEWIVAGGLLIREIPAHAYAQIAIIVRKYADRKIDFADACLVWYAGVANTRTIVTVDVADFSVYRIRGGAGFRLIDWADSAVVALGRTCFCRTVRSACKL
jgi:predicted nucleic acid-binding protein